MKQDRRKTDTKEKIIHTAIRLFAEKGLDRVSIRDIAAHVGITAASFYNHYQSKDQLLDRMYEYYRIKIIEPVIENINLEKMMDDLGAAGFLEKLIEIMFQTEHDEELFRLSRIIATEQFRNKTAAEIAYRSREKSRELLTELFIRMEEKGLIHTKDPAIIAQIMGYALTGLSIDYYHQRFIQEIPVDTIMEKQKEFVSQFCINFLHPVIPERPGT